MSLSPPSDKAVLNDATQANREVNVVINRVRLHDQPVYGDRGESDWRHAILDYVNSNHRVLDVGKSSREFYDRIQEKAGKIDTLDINDFGDYPNLICDLCQPIPDQYHAAYDVIVFLAILQCVYDPQAALDNVFRLLKPGGRLFLFAPFISKYDAPRDLLFRDFYRFSRDGLAYLLRDFEQVELYPVRGQYSTALNLLPNWKLWVETRLGHGPNRWVDRLGTARSHALNTSGYNVIAVKPDMPRA